MFIKDSPANIAATQDAANQMAEKLQHNRDLCEKLIPDWGIGCRRITPGEGYLESFLQPNVHCIKNSIVKITEDSVITVDGEETKVDVLVCATGFDVSLRPQWNMVGRNGTDLRKDWAIDPESYLSVAARDMPNYFMFMGPNAVIAHGSLMEGLNWTGDYIVKWIRKMATEDIKSIVPESSVVDELIKYGDQIHKTLIWSDSCKSWYKRNTVDGRVTAAFAGSALMFRKLIGEIRPEDFDIDCRTPNRWHFLGNGFIDYELDETNDLSWYIKN